VTAGCGHKYRCKGFAPGHYVSDRGCVRPLMYVCEYCDDVRYSACGTGNEEKCAPCAAVKRGDLRRIGRSGADSPGVLWFLTLTAPGGDVLPWATDLCGHGPDVECSGKRGCRIDPVALAAWHATLAKRWSYFRQFMGRAGIDVQYLKSYELQRRGAVHAHVMVRVPAGVPERLLHQLVRSYARHYGWGPQVKLDRLGAEGSPDSVRRAAAYVAKYACKGSGVKVERLNFATGELESCGLRSWSASGSWGMRMWQCRLERARFAAARAAGVAAARRATAPGAAGALDLNNDYSTTGGVVAVPSALVGAVPV
jgi:hypothetical protein